jgi:hypothetical protein
MVVYYSVSGTASSEDYTPALPDSVVIADGNTSTTITITPVDDELVEGNETVILTLGSGTGYSVGSPSSATITIADNDGSLYEDMIAYWPFEEGSGTSAEDVTPNTHNGTLINGAAFSGDSQAGSYSVLLDGDNDYVNTGTINLGSEFTLAMWVKMPSWVSNIQTILANCSSGAGQNGLALEVNTYGTTDRRIIFYTGNGSSYNSAQTATNVFDFTQWNHVAVVVDKSAGKALIYYNGSNVSSDSLVRNDFGTNQAVHLGQFTNNSWTMEGNLDDVRIYDYQLSASEVDALANEASLPVITVTATDASATEAGETTGTYRVSRGAETSGNLAVNFSTGGTATQNTDYTLSASGSVTISNGNTYADITLTPYDDAFVEGDETAIITVTSGIGYTVGSPSAATVTITDNDGSSYEDMIAFWAFEEGSGTTAQDSTGNNYNGMLTNGAAFNADEKYGDYSIYLDGTDDFMNAGTIDLGNEFSVSLWAKIPSSGVNDLQTLFANTSSGNTQNGIKIFVNTYGTTDRKIIVETGNGSSANPALTSTNVFAWDQWNYVAVVVDKTNGKARIYYNGTDVTADSLIRNDFATNQVVHLGQTTNNNARMKGYLDHVKIYNRKLTSTETVNLKRALLSPVEISDPSVIVYPNPFKDVLMLKNVQDVIWIELVDISGKELLIRRNMGQPEIEIETSSLIRGIYFVSIFRSTGETLVYKVVKL